MTVPAITLTCGSVDPPQASANANAQANSDPKTCADAEAASYAAAQAIAPG